ncbi:MAG: hypothetical protein V2I35_13265 [Desulfocapsaceae bacterium]|nr:hypothetical protein [Desulfocapsaceae bacterium]
MRLNSKMVFLAVSLTFLVLFLSPPTASCAEPVSARLYQSGGTTTFIELTLAPPAPPTLIVEIKLPSNVRVIKSVPEFSKQNSNTLKWLLKNVTGSSYKIQLVTGSKLDLDSSPVYIRYRDNNSGSIREVQADR